MGSGKGRQKRTNTSSNAKITPEALKELEIDKEVGSIKLFTELEVGLETDLLFSIDVPVGINELTGKEESWIITGVRKEDGTIRMSTVVGVGDTVNWGCDFNFSDFNEAINDCLTSSNTTHMPTYDHDKQEELASIRFGKDVLWNMINVYVDPERTGGRVYELEYERVADIKTAIDILNNKSFLWHRRILVSNLRATKFPHINF